MKWLIYFVATSVGLSATTTLYVDPNFTGTPLGTASQPFLTLNSGAWTTINTDLASGPVTVYFAARKSASDTNQIYDTAGNGVQLEVDLTQKTDTSGNLLTLDGKSFYTTDDTTPNWVAYSGTNMCIVRDFNSQNAGHTKHSDITINGFYILMSGNGKEVTIAGDNWTLQNCDSSHTALGAGGPGILVVPTADNAHGGSGSWIGPCTNILIQSNYIHDTAGEGIYIGGGGTPIDGSAGAGYPSHSGISVLFNRLQNMSLRDPAGGQGDGIDLKSGIYNVLVRGNDISSNNWGSNIRGIIVAGQTNGSTGTQLIIERNYIHDAVGITGGISDGAIAFSDTIGVPQGVIVRNNKISNISGPGACNGIQIQTSQDQLIFDNNTIYNCKGNGINMAVSGGVSVKLRNNAVYSNNSSGNQVTLRGTPDTDYNSHDFAWGYASEGAHSISNGVAQALSLSSLYPSGTSPLINAGETQAGFSDDYAGTARPQGAAWDIGAYEFIYPAPPSFWAGAIRAGRVSKP